jgi:hypothetical protein
MISKPREHESKTSGTLVPGVLEERETNGGQTYTFDQTVESVGVTPMHLLREAGELQTQRIGEKETAQWYNSSIW